MRDLNVPSLPFRQRTANALRPFSLAVAVLACGICIEPALAQQPHAVPGRPGQGAIPGLPGMPAMGPGAGQPGRPVPGAAPAGGPKGPVKELQIDPNKLPDKYTPPSDKDPVMIIDRPLASTDEIATLKKDLAKYQTTLRTARLTDQDKALIRNGIRYRLALMCIKDNRLQLSKLHEDLLRDLNSAAVAPDNAKPAVVKEFRQFVLQELMSQAAPLLTTQNFYVRLHIAILLGELNLTEENAKLALKVEAFVPSIEPLLQIVADPKQPEAIKVVAVNGLVRILRLGNPVIALRTKIASVIVAEVANKKLNSWYQMRLVGALAVIDVDLDQARVKPTVVDCLKSVLADDEREYTVRAEAAKSLGRVPLPPSTNPPTVTRAIAAFALKLAKAAQQSPQQKPDDPKWKSEFIKIYLAFQPLDANDLAADKKSKAGLLNNTSTGAKAAYDVIVPLVASILHGQRLTVQQLQPLQDYVGQNPPQEAKANDNKAPVVVGGGGPR